MNLRMIPQMSPRRSRPTSYRSNRIFGNVLAARSPSGPCMDSFHLSARIQAMSGSCPASDVIPARRTPACSQNCFLTCSARKNSRQKLFFTLKYSSLLLPSYSLKRVGTHCSAASYAPSSAAYSSLVPLASTYRKISRSSPRRISAVDAGSVQPWRGASASTSLIFRYCMIRQVRLLPPKSVSPFS